MKYLCFGITLALATTWDIAAQGTAFTYQGRLNDGANPANGSYDLQTILYDAAVGGNQIGPVLTNSAVLATNGYMTMTLDFGPSFPGGDRWLDIGVRSNGIGSFTPLTPRQKVTATPYAITAGNVSGTVAGSQLTGTVADSRLSANVALRSTANTFTGDQTINGALNVNSPGYATATAIVRARPSDDIPWAVQDVAGNNLLLMNTNSLTTLRGSLNLGSLAGGDAGVLNVNGGFLNVTMTVKSRPSDDIAFSTESHIGGTLLRVYTNGQVNIGGNLYAGGVLNGNGAGLTSLNASQLSSGSVADGRLSANVSLLGAGIESSEITDGTIVNADINAAAAIADTKLATISTAGKVANSALSSSVSLLGQSIESAEITDGSIVNADVNAAAAIADTKLATISSAGKVADSALSANVALRTAGNTFTGNQTVNGGLNHNGVFTGYGDVRLYAWEGNGSNGTAFVQARDVSGTSSIDLVLRSQNNGAATDVVRVKADGNVGIGTNTPSTKLEVNGTVTASEVKVAGGNYYASAADVPLRIVRGHVNADGSIHSGGAFTVNRTALGTYVVTYATPFTDPPAVACMGGFAAIITAQDTASFTVLLCGNISFIPGDFHFNFIAIGGR